MPLSDDQQERYSGIYWDAYVDAQDADSSTPQGDAVLTVAEVAQRDLVERMIADIRQATDATIVYYDGEYGEIEHDRDPVEWLTTFLPTEATDGS